MAVTKTDIVNKALTLAGAAPVNDITEDSTNARTVSRVYETALRSVLSECKWNFATTRATLSVVGVTLPFYDTGETIVYQKPTDMIRIYSTDPPSAVWREEGDYIVSDSADLGVRYVYYLDTPSKYPMYFIDALIDKLVSEIAYSIVNSATLAEKYVDKYDKRSLPKAMSANSQTGVQQQPIDDAWDLAKFTDNHPTS
jgi:hypothetical protein